MKTFFTYFFISLYSLSLSAQNKVVCQADSNNPNTIHIKWYFSKLVNSEGYNIYRKEKGTTVWDKLNQSPILFKNYQATGEEYRKDKELKSYQELAAKPENIKDLVLLALVIKSFKSDALSKYLGIWYDDKTVVIGKHYEYKICLFIKNTEQDSAVSSSIVAGKYLPIDPPKKIKSQSGNKKVSFTWLPEPNLFFGVNIYRQTKDSGQFFKLTKDPILLSTTKNTKGEESYGEEFFVDTKLKVHTKYNYYIEALDFFGNPSIQSQIISITLKDQDAPKAPDSVWQKLNGKKVLVNWQKKIKEDDLLGYNIYRTTHNDTDFVKLNSSLVLKSDSYYADSVSTFGSYLYAVSSVDQDLNESISNPHFIEVYDNEAPAKPKNLIIHADSGRLHLSWDKNTELDLKGYLIYRTINKNNENTYVKITARPITSNFYDDILAKNIKNNFLYKVVAIDESLNRSPYSEFAISKMPDIIAPQQPFLKNIQINEKKQILLEWFPNAEPDLAGYNIFRKNILDSSSEFLKINTKTLSRNVFRYTDRNTNEGCIYDYYLKAIDSSENSSEQSNILRIKTKNTLIETEIKITSFEVKYNSKKNRVELKWKLKNEIDLKTSIMYKKKQGEAVLSPFSGTLEQDKLTDTDISKGIHYTYQLRIYNQRGDVFKSESISLLIP